MRSSRASHFFICDFLPYEVDPRFVSTAWRNWDHIGSACLSAQVHRGGLESGLADGKPIKVIFAKAFSFFWQIVECRRILKWTYSYGYYLPLQERKRREFFEYLQGSHDFHFGQCGVLLYCNNLPFAGDAESALERLHNCAEKELIPFCSQRKDGALFTDFKTKLAGLTR